MAKKAKKIKRNNRAAYVLILPSFLTYSFFTLIPIVWSVAMYNLKTANFIGLTNYKKMFSDALFLSSVWHTIYYTLLTIPLGMILGLILAVLLNRNIPLRGMFRAGFYMPNILSMIAVGMAWLYLYETNFGILNRILTSVGLDKVKWISSPSMAMISVAIMSIWHSMGYNMVVYLSGLQSIPTHLYEAALIDGANAWQSFWHITLPLLRPTTFFIFVMACIRSFQVFGQVYVLTNGGPVNSTTTIAHQIYLNGFNYYDMGYASSQAVLLLVIILGITLINMKFGGSESDLAG